MTKQAPSVAHYMSRIPQTIESSKSLADAHELIRKYQIRHLPVLENGKLVGLISERDLLLVESLDAVDPREVRIDKAMNRSPYAVDVDTPVDEVAAVMSSRRIGSAVVQSGGDTVGIFTTIDALVALFHIWKQVP